MAAMLACTIGQHSDAGRKPVNQDFHGAITPRRPVLDLKGIAIAIADGVSSSQVSQIASETAVKSFLSDYYCTSDAWSAKTSAYRVIAATNAWLYAETRRSEHADEREKGYVCTFSAMVLKSCTAHLFHVGDSRIYRVAGEVLEQLTEDHRVVISATQSYLGRALGVNPVVEIDYQAIPLKHGDIFVLATDGVYEFISARGIVRALADHGDDFDAAAGEIVATALANGSADNLTIQIVRIDDLPDGEALEALDQANDLPAPPLLEARMVFDGFRIERELHASNRSHIYLANDVLTGALVALKIPSIDLRGDAAYLRRFMMEEWIGRRIDNPHVLKPIATARKRNYLYIVTEFIEGQTLEQWMRDNPTPGLETVRGIVEQIARGLQAFHRKEMLHQDLRPANVMIDNSGTVKIIDFGSTRVAGVIEVNHTIDGAEILGTAQYTAPEYFLGEGGSDRSDLYSLAAITYQMLSGRLPYGSKVPSTTTRQAQRGLKYVPIADETRDYPAWIDPVLERALAPDPLKRTESLSEFVHDLRHPRDTSLQPRRTPLIERNPSRVWQIVSGLLFVIVIVQFILQATGRR